MKMNYKRMIYYL